MQQVADWLEKLGLGQYAQRFAENDISFSVLPDLTDQHLKEIGVSLGHRLQLLRAIAELSGATKLLRGSGWSASALPQDIAERLPSSRTSSVDGALGAYGQSAWKSPTLFCSLTADVTAT